MSYIESTVSFLSYSHATTKYEEFLWGKPINQSVLMKWKYRGFINKHAEFHNLHNYFCKY